MKKTTLIRKFETPATAFLALLVALSVAHAEDKGNTPLSEKQKPSAKKEELLKELPSRISLRAVGELQTAKVARAVESERQLYEVLVDFWANHFRKL